MMAAVFSMQGAGQLGGAIVMVCLVAGYKDTLEKASSYATCTGHCQVAVDRMWRALIGIGIVPACIALYYRLTIPETPSLHFRRCPGRGEGRRRRETLPLWQER